MDARFANLKKIPREPAARLLAGANARLSTPLKAAASAPIETVLEELNTAGATFDMLRLLAVALPPRERIWWACLAARDLLGPGAEAPASLSAAEAWVFKPTDANREAARAAAEAAEVGDDTSLCGTAVAMNDGRLGTGDMAEHAAPPGAAATAVFGMAMLALSRNPEDHVARGRILIDRALDIARGGNGRLERPAETPTESAQ
jgi:hypothetical protein